MWPLFPRPLIPDPWGRPASNGTGTDAADLRSTFPLSQRGDPHRAGYGALRTQNPRPCGRNVAPESILENQFLGLAVKIDSGVRNRATQPEKPAFPDPKKPKKLSVVLFGCSRFEHRDRIRASDPSFASDEAVPAEDRLPVPGPARGERGKRGRPSSKARIGVHGRGDAPNAWLGQFKFDFTDPNPLPGLLLPGLESSDDDVRSKSPHRAVARNRGREGLGRCKEHRISVGEARRGAVGLWFRLNPRIPIGGMSDEAIRAAEPIGKPCARGIRLLDHLPLGFPERRGRGRGIGFVDRLEFVPIAIEFEVHA